MKIKDLITHLESFSDEWKEYRIAVFDSENRPIGKVERGGGCVSLRPIENTNVCDPNHTYFCLTLSTESVSDFYHSRLSPSELTALMETYRGQDGC